MLGRGRGREEADVLGPVVLEVENHRLGVVRHGHFVILYEVYEFFNKAVR